MEVDKVFAKCLLHRMVDQLESISHQFTAIGGMVQDADEEWGVGIGEASKGLFSIVEKLKRLENYHPD